jgi:hypothetical protein
MAVMLSLDGPAQTGPPRPRRRRGGQHARAGQPAAGALTGLTGLPGMAGMAALRRAAVPPGRRGPGLPPARPLPG